jgi:UDP-glucose 4-epimerase
VRDVVHVLPKLIANPACYGRVFNIGREEPITIHALAKLVIDTLGSPSAVRFVAYEHAFAAGFDDLKVRQPDLTRIRGAVGFTPQISLVQTIRDLAVEIASRDGTREGQQAAACAANASGGAA